MAIRLKAKAAGFEAAFQRLLEVRRVSGADVGFVEMRQSLNILLNLMAVILPHLT
jgi:hypothetical protein